MITLKKVLFVLTVLIVALHSKIKAQKQYYLLYSNKALNHRINDTCTAKFNNENSTLILYSGKHIDTLNVEPKEKARLFKYYIGLLFKTGYYIVVNGKSIYLKNGLTGLKELNDKYDIQHYSHNSHASHASHASHYSNLK